MRIGHRFLPEISPAAKKHNSKLVPFAFGAEGPFLVLSFENVEIGNQKYLITDRILRKRLVTELSPLLWNKNIRIWKYHSHLQKKIIYLFHEIVYNLSKSVGFSHSLFANKYVFNDERWEIAAILMNSI